MPFALESRPVLASLWWSPKTEACAHSGSSGWLEMNILSPVQVSVTGTSAAAAAAPVLAATPPDRCLAKSLECSNFITLAVVE